MNRKSNSSKIIFSLLLLLVVFTGGAAGTMTLQRMCAAEAGRVKSAEVSLKKLKRENDFWNAQIAISRDPAALRRRAADKFKLPESKNTVFAYQIQERSPDGTAKSVFAFGPRKTSKELKTAKR